MQKIIVFDLDETLGYFTQFGIFCDTLDNCLEINSISDAVNSFGNNLNLCSRLQILVR